MPADYVIDVDAGAVISRAWGVLTDFDLLDHQRRLGADPAFKPGFNQLFNFSDVTLVELTAEGIRTLAERNLFRAGARRAFLVHPGALTMFGLLRMFEILTSQYPDELRVEFNHVDAAREWLGLPPSGGGHP